MGMFLEKLNGMMAESQATWTLLLEEALARLTLATHASLADECLRQGLFRHLNDLFLAQTAMLQKVGMFSLLPRGFICF